MGVGMMENTERIHRVGPKEEVFVGGALFHFTT